MKKIFTAVFFLALSLTVFSQNDGTVNYDFVYLDNIKSVKFHVRGLFTTMPILDLGGRGQLELTFDDLDGDFKDYRYTIVHCNADWSSSDLFDNEYLNGFPENDLDNYEFSFKTPSIYTNYRLLFPNQDLGIILSGNYLLHVFEDEDERRPAITRRFMVVEQEVKILPDVVRPANVSKVRTHQEVDFIVTNESFEIRNPRTEIKATILQNGRWDNAITGVAPLFTRSSEQVFDYQDKIVFPAGKEYRSADLRSIRFGSPDIAEVYYDEVKKVNEVDLKPDRKRGNQAYLNREDINGQFVIDNFDEDNPDLMSDYVQTLFTLYSPGEMEGHELYIFGGLSDWQLKPEFKMVYNPAVTSYVAKVNLKQGYYDYTYAALPAGADEIDFEVTEGDSFEAQNNYTILVYFRPFGGRHDQLIGSVSFNSRL